MSVNAGSGNRCHVDELSQFCTTARAAQKNDEGHAPLVSVQILRRGSMGWFLGSTSAVADQTSEPPISL